MDVGPDAGTTCVDGITSEVRYAKFTYNETPEYLGGIFSCRLDHWVRSN
jgi:hypothetical protein